MLDECIRATQGAHDTLLDLKELEADNHDAFRTKYQALAAAARIELGKGLVHIATPET